MYFEWLAEQEVTMAQAGEIVVPVRTRNVDQWPSVGRIVHLRHRDHRDVCLMAGVTGVPEQAYPPTDIIDVQGFPVTLFPEPLRVLRERTPDDLDYAFGDIIVDSDWMWHWPEYVGPGASADRGPDGRPTV